MQKIYPENSFRLSRNRKKNENVSFNYEINHRRW